MKRNEVYGTPLSKALTVSLRVFADLAYRSLTFSTSPATSCALWSRHGMLIVAARGHTAREIEALLADVGIVPQIDLPEQIDPQPRKQVVA